MLKRQNDPTLQFVVKASGTSYAMCQKQLAFWRLYVNRAPYLQLQAMFTILQLIYVPFKSMLIFAFQLNSILFT